MSTITESLHPPSTPAIAAAGELTAASIGVQKDDAPWPGGLPTFRLREHVIVDDGESGGLRDIPYATRGRDHETATLAKLLQTLPETICVIKGAPGTGKSALLANLIEYQRAKGCQVRKLTPQDFETNAGLANAIAGIDLPEHGQASELTTEWSGRVEGNVAVIKGEGAASRSRTIRIDTAAAWFRAIMGANRLATEAGTLLAIDEAQDLDRYPEGSPTWLRIQQFLQVMNSEIMAPREAGRPHIALVASGLLNVSDVLNGFGMSRLNGHGIIRLGPLSDRATQQVLQDHWEAKNPKGPAIPAPPEHLVTALIETAGGNAHHITAAGLALQSVGTGIVRERRTAWEPADVTAAIAKAGTRREQLYNERVIDNLTPAERGIADTIAYATQAWGPCLPVDDTLSLIGAIAREHGEDPEGAKVTLTRKGITEKRETADVFPTRAARPEDRRHLAFPIHSMAGHLNRLRTERSRQTQIEAGYDALIHQHLGDATAERRIRPWDWDDSQPLPPLDALPERFAPPPHPTAERISQLLQGLGDLAVQALDETAKKP